MKVFMKKNILFYLCMLTTVNAFGMKEKITVNELTFEKIVLNQYKINNCEKLIINFQIDLAEHDKYGANSLYNGTFCKNKISSLEESIKSKKEKIHFFIENKFVSENFIASASKLKPSYKKIAKELEKYTELQK